MSKKFLSLVLLLLVSACVVEKTYQYCPYVTISREDAKLIQKVNYQDDFMVELKGFDGYCYFDSRVKQEKAVITPIFVITKLRNTDETDVQFSWFTNTIKGPPAYLGRRSYFAGTHIGQGERVKEFKGRPVEVKIPAEMMYEFEIFMGLDVSKEEKKYNQRIFDVEYDYYEYPPKIEAPAVKLKVYPEVYYEDGTPVEPEYLKGRNEGPERLSPAAESESCGSCGLK